MRRWLRSIFSRLRNVLLISFALIAIVTFVVQSWATASVVEQYMEKAESERVDRDINLAVAFYDSALSQLGGAAARLSAEPDIAGLINSLSSGAATSAEPMQRRLVQELTTIQPPGTTFILVVDQDSTLVAAFGLLDGQALELPIGGSWRAFPLLETALDKRTALAATEAIDEALLQAIGLAARARIPLKETAKASPQPFDPREGTAGLAQVACAPVLHPDGELAGAVVVGHLFNNDFTLVDRIQAVAGVDTATIFFGDLRVSTNVREGNERAIGTRVSQAVFDTVLSGGEPFTGVAYVVQEWFITRYLPLRDHRGAVIGMLYVGVRRATFVELQRMLERRIVSVALLAIVPVALLALPIARLITRPLEDMARASREVAHGDTHVRVPDHGVGEVGVLGQAFNAMIADLDAMMADLEETQTQLIQKERMASMGQLAAGVAHQLNNPLGTILLFSDIVLKDLPEDAPAREDIHMIAQEAHRAKETVTALLNFARQQKVWAQPTSLGTMLHDLAERLRHQPKAEHVGFVEEIAPDLPPIEADAAQLENVFANIIDNALDAMPEGGTVTLRAAPTTDRQSVVAEIEDTGCGIPAEGLNRIFSPFYTTKPLGQGTGLGLAIAYGIVKVHHGTIHVRSQVGKGSTFSVTLPIRLPRATTQPAVSTGTIAPAAGAAPRTPEPPGGQP
jgi:two-component system, NtrC family, sensor kinase